MRHLTACIGLALVAACEARINAGPSGGATDAAGAEPTGDASVDLPALDAPDAATPLGAWSMPVKVAPAATSLPEDDVTLSQDALEMFFAIDPGNGTGKHLFEISRSSTSEDWAATPSQLPFDSDTPSDESPRLSVDGKTLFFASARDSGNGTLDIFAVDRAAAGSTTTWGSPRPITSANSAATDKWYMRCGGSHYVVVRTNANGDGDLYEGSVGSAPSPIDELNATENDTAPFITDDCLTIYFASARVSPMRIFTATRSAIGEPWQTPTAMHDFDAIGGNQEDPWISPDGRTFAFATDVAGKGNKDVYITTR